MADVMTICPYCGTGCSMSLSVTDNKIIDINGDPTHPVSEGELCLKGMYGFKHVADPGRLTTPLMRRGDSFVAVDWDTALDAIADQLGVIKKESGPDAFAVFSSARATNEENYVAQKFARAVLGTNSVDHCARLCHAPTTVGLTMTLGDGAMTNSIPELGDVSDLIFIIGSNTAECHPLIAKHVLKAKARGAKLIVADPRMTDMANKADLWLRIPLGHDIPLINAMLHVIIKEGLQNTDFIRDHSNGFDDLARAVEDYSPERVSQMTGVPATDIAAAGRAFATAKAAATLYAMGVTQFSCGTGNVVSIANLAVVTGQIGRPGAGVCPLRGQSNVQGACDLGALPNVYPGGRPITSEPDRLRFEEAWGVALSPKVGVKITEIPAAILAGKVRAIIVDGENPMMSDPNTQHFAHALEKLDLLVVIDLFMTETARRAHIVLPAGGWGEKDGTFTNTERRVQRVRPAVLAPGEAKADWWIFKALAERMGYQGMAYDRPKDIWDEVRRMAPTAYAGMTYERLETTHGLCSPCPAEDHPGTPVLHAGGLFHTPSGKAALKPVLFHPISVPEEERKAFDAPIIGHIAERPDNEYPFMLTTGRRVYHYHTGTMTRRAPLLEQIGPEELIEINPADANALFVRDRQYIKINTRRGSVIAKAWVTERVPPGVVFSTFHFWEASSNEETNADNLDPLSGIPEYKVSAAQVTKSSAADAQASVAAKREYYRQDVETAAIVEMRAHAAASA
ncbi:MAG: formate dehydrogenase subunit alpha [Methylocella sp.]